MTAPVDPPERRRGAVPAATTEGRRTLQPRSQLRRGHAETASSPRRIRANGGRRSRNPTITTAPVRSYGCRGPGTRAPERAAGCIRPRSESAGQGQHQALDIAVAVAPEPARAALFWRSQAMLGPSTWWRGRRHNVVRMSHRRTRNGLWNAVPTRRVAPTPSCWAWRSLQVMASLRDRQP